MSFMGCPGQCVKMPKSYTWLQFPPNTAGFTRFLPVGWRNLGLLWWDCLEDWQIRPNLLNYFSNNALAAGGQFSHHVNQHLLDTEPLIKQLYSKLAVPFTVLWSWCQTGSPEGWSPSLVLALKSRWVELGELQGEKPELSWIPFPSSQVLPLHASIYAVVLPDHRGRVFLLLTLPFILIFSSHSSFLCSFTHCCPLEWSHHSHSCLKLCSSSTETLHPTVIPF